VEVQDEDNMESEYGPKMKNSVEIIHAIISAIIASVSIISESMNSEALLNVLLY
jgi:hypothetical protein